LGGSAVVVKYLRGWLGRLLLAAVGLGLVVYLVKGAGVARVGHVLVAAGPWLPAIFALEIAQMISDVIALRFLLPRRGRDVPLATWLRSSAVTYAMMILLPAGRAAGEVTRATLMSKHVGASAAATASTQLQAGYIAAMAFAACVDCAGVASSAGFAAPLTLFLLLTATLTLAGAIAILAALANPHVSQWLDALRRRFKRNAAPLVLDAARGRLDFRAIVACCGGRVCQIAQYTLILTAIGGKPTLRAGLTAHGIHLVGATVGDIFPNQLGIVDGAYRAFAPMLGFGNAPERALSIAFIAHAVQLSMATVCVIVGALVRRARSPFESQPDSRPNPA
jgi:uncharacterized membrane protein YbhN (UPF0104 family)